MEWPAEDPWQGFQSLAVAGEERALECILSINWSSVDLYPHLYPHLQCRMLWGQKPAEDIARVICPDVVLGADLLYDPGVGQVWDRCIWDRSAL